MDLRARHTCGEDFVRYGDTHLCIQWTSNEQLTTGNFTGAYVTSAIFDGINTLFDQLRGAMLNKLNLDAVF